MDIALHFDAMVGKHMPVVLNVLTQLVCGRVFQPGLELGQYFVARQLFGRIGVTVGQRNIGRLARLNTERNPHDLGTHFVQGVGFGIQRYQLSRLQPGQPGVKNLPGEDRFVTRMRYARGLRGWCAALFVKQAGAGGGFGGTGARRGGRWRIALPLQGLGQPLESVLQIKITQIARG